MTQENIELLNKDLCGRTPYGVKFRYKYINNFFHEDYATSRLKGVIPPYHIIHSTLVGDEYLQIEEDEVKPYLFPLSSMTEEQKIEYNILWENTFIHHKDDYMNKLYEFYKENHLDNNGLIPKGLAINATNLNIY